jgi:hypothetical protein
MIVNGITSHGTCENCLKNIVLPSYAISYWLKDYNKNYICEV